MQGMVGRRRKKVTTNKIHTRGERGEKEREKERKKCFPPYLSKEAFSGHKVVIYNDNL